MTYEELGTAAGRAQQAWLILIGAAMRKQVMSYEELAVAMGLSRRAARFMGQFLGPVYFFCRRHGLPLLNVLVVGKVEGIPGPGMEVENVPAIQQQVYGFDWYSVCPPTRKQLEQARVAGDSEL